MAPAPPHGSGGPPPIPKPPPAEPPPKNAIPPPPGARKKAAAAAAAAAERQAAIDAARHKPGPLETLLGKSGVLPETQARKVASYNAGLVGTHAPIRHRDIVPLYKHLRQAAHTTKVAETHAKGSRTMVGDAAHIAHKAAHHATHARVTALQAAADAARTAASAAAKAAAAAQRADADVHGRHVRGIGVGSDVGAALAAAKAARKVARHAVKHAHGRDDDALGALKAFGNPAASRHPHPHYGGAATYYLSPHHGHNGGHTNGHSGGGHSNMKHGVYIR